MDHALVLSGASAGGVQADDLEPGRILVAPPDHHLVVQTTNVRVTRAAERGLSKAASKHERHAGELRDHAHTIRGTLETLSGSAVVQEPVR